MNTRKFGYITDAARNYLVCKRVWLHQKLTLFLPGSARDTHNAYDALRKEEYDSDDASPELYQLSATWKYLLLGVSERLFWMSLSAILIAAVFIQHYGVGIYSYESGFSTDLGVATPHIALRQTVYTGGVVRNNEGKLVLDHTGAPIVYVGEPSPELDAKWDRLESAIEITLASKDAKTKGGVKLDTMESDGIYRTSLDVVHSLHCLNQLRKVLYREYYFPGKPNEFFYVHMNHCIDHLRQALKCHSDLTPLNYQWSEEHDRALPTWTSKHTCRDFDKMLEWDLTETGTPLSETEDYKNAHRQGNEPKVHGH